MTTVGLKELAHMRLHMIDSAIDRIESKIHLGSDPRSILNETTVIGRHLRKLNEEMNRATDDGEVQGAWIE